jgi:AraC-like DNA-binding protein
VTAGRQGREIHIEDHELLSQVLPSHLAVTAEGLAQRRLQGGHIGLGRRIARGLEFVGHVELLGIRFRAGGAFPFLGIPLVEVRNQLDVLDVLDRSTLLQLHSRLCESRSMAARIGLLEDWLVERLSLGITRSALIPQSLARLRQGLATLPRGACLPSIPALADDLAISQRQLEHLFRSQVGMTPMHYLRLQRVEIARLALKQKKQSAARLAADLGYFDQAHFIREFRSVIGLTPYAYMMRKHQESAHQGIGLGAADC